MKILYKFTKHSETWCFNSSDTPVSFQGVEFAPSALQHTGVQFDGSADSLQMTITFPNDIPFAEVPFTDGDIFVQLFHGDTTFIQFFAGWASSKKLTGGENTIVVDHYLKVFDEESLNLTHTANCQRMLYGAGCGLSREQNNVEATVQTVDKNTIGISLTSSYDDNWFRGGVCQFNNQLQTITSSNNAQITLFRTLAGVKAGDKLLISPGCDRAYGTCDTKFNNLENAVMFPLIPVLNIFEEGAR